MALDAAAAHGDAGGLFTELLLIFTAALVLVALCRPLRLPGIFGYFAAGALLGPTGLAFVYADEDIQRLVDFGVVMLLFSLGLEFSLPRLLAMRRAVFGVGVVQVVGTGGLFAAILASGGIALGVAVVLGVGMALSSTAIVSRELAGTGQLHLPHGRQAIGVLLFQDIAAVALLILVPLVGGGGADGSGILADFAWLGLAGAALFVGLMAIGRWVLPPLFTEIARSRSSELFVLAALVTVMATAWLTQAMGLSMALGGFVGGMMLGESHFRHQVESDLRPFRDVLLGVFLISVGMMLDLHLLAEFWPRILVFGVLLMLFKGVVVCLISLAFRDSLRTAVRSGLVLAQGGEFAFAVLALLAGQGMVEGDVQAFLVTVTLVSMVLTPLLVRRSESLAEWIVGHLLATPAADPDAPPTGPGPEDAAPVVLLGFGRVGQVIARMLERSGVPHLALDNDAERVAEGQLAGVPVRFGDVTRGDLLAAAQVHEAQLVVICIDPPGASLQALRAVRELAPSVPVLVRTRDDSRLGDYLDAGATEVVPETLESSLMLLSHVLALLRRPRSEIESVIASVRGERYRLLHGVIPGSQGGAYREIVHPVRLTERAWACDREAEEVDAKIAGVRFRGIRRRERTLEAQDAGVLQVDDIVVLMGPPEAVEAGEETLLRG
ncbi:MAG: cation:proton antiporter [Pseudomonadales bacterium]|jgi:CPA2 family monovalent cation:H+ antiporter-2|nr:cation:proton antiporter [Pseudomonadales bacterium]